MNYLIVIYFVSIYSFSWFVSKVLVRRIKNNIAKLYFSIAIILGFFVLILNTSEVDYYAIDVFSLKTLDIFYRCFCLNFLMFFSTTFKDNRQSE